MESKELWEPDSISEVKEPEELEEPKGSKVPGKAEEKVKSGPSKVLRMI